MSILREGAANEKGVSGSSTVAQLAEKHHITPTAEYTDGDFPVKKNPISRTARSGQLIGPLISALDTMFDGDDDL